MNNVTYNGNKLKRIYVNNQLLESIKYNNKDILGYRSTKYESIQCYNTIGNNISNSGMFLNRDYNILTTDTIHFCNGCDFKIYPRRDNIGSSGNLSLLISDIEIFRFETNIGTNTWSVYCVGTQFYSGSIDVLSVITTPLNNNGLVRVTVTIDNNQNYSKVINIYNFDNPNRNFGRVIGSCFGDINIQLDGGFNVCTQYPIE